MDETILSFVQLPPGAVRIAPPAKQTPVERPEQTEARAFPPPPTAPAARKFAVPSTSSLSSNVSDLVLSSLLPPNLPKASAVHVPSGRARALTTQREELGLNVMSNNFRRFVTKVGETQALLTVQVGPIFWLQDRVEEVLFWQKPVWTWAWMVTWTFICFKPRILFFLPTALLLILFTYLQERKAPVAPIFGVPQTAPPVGTARVGSGETGHSASTAPETEGAPTVPPKEAETTIDYYMNIQAIQNLMGLIADGFDAVIPYLALIDGRDTSPTSFPLRPTHVVLLLIPPTLLLPLTPAWAIAYLLVPVGIVPPLLFHPNLITAIEAFPRSRLALRVRAKAEDYALSDTLSDELGSRRLARVQVWENERLDPAVAAKSPQTSPPGCWSARFLRAGERAPWVKIRDGSLWAEEDKPDDGPMVLALQDGWTFIPGEDWRVDVCGLWSETGTDADGWAYADDAWLHAAPSGAPTATDKRKVTRRRRWWRRVHN